jgi:hypothetical protein
VIIRKIEEGDRVLLSTLIAQDPYHKELLPDFFYEPLSMAFEDHAGVVFFVRLEPQAEKILRIHMQFRQSQTLRTALLLRRGFSVVRDKAKASGYRKLIFDSVYKPLREFCISRFGFRPIDNSDDLELELS